jgi:tetratricopeptide (TPR) repeat protein
VVDPASARLAIVVATDRDVRESCARAIAAGWASARHAVADVAAAPAASWPFTHPLRVAPPKSPAIVWMPDVHEAFVNHQTGSTRLVTTQASYLMQAWLDLTSDCDVLLLAMADPASLDRHAPEALAGRGPFGQALISVRASPPPLPERARAREIPDGRGGGPGASKALLAAAMRTGDPAERLALCVKALDEGRSAGALLATASACMEVNDLEAAARALDEAVALTPDWAAAHFERGKMWLRVDDMERASQSFRDAAAQMPRFASAWANLGATLGELDRPAEALSAFEQALRADPSSPQTLNNIGVVNRELGNLADSEAAFRRVIELAPNLAFGYYNLGHTLFLQGRYHAALSTYVEGQKRDPERNPVQASRLGLCRLASGDATGALDELQRAMRGLPPEYKQQLLADTNAIACALLTHRPELPGWKQVHDWLTGELAKCM